MLLEAKRLNLAGEGRHATLDVKRRKTLSTHLPQIMALTHCEILCIYVYLTAKIYHIVFWCSSSMTMMLVHQTWLPPPWLPPEARSSASVLSPRPPPEALRGLEKLLCPRVAETAPVRVGERRLERGSSGAARTALGRQRPLDLCRSVGFGNREKVP